MSRYSDGTFQASHSELATFKQCRRKWYLSYHRSLRKNESKLAIARDVGILVHGVMEEFYHEGGLDGEDAKGRGERYFDAQRVEAFTAAESMDREYIKELEKIYKLAWVITTGYWDWLETYGEDLPYENFKSEDKLTMTGPHEAILNGRLDLMADHKDTGDITVMDFKVVQSIEGMIQTLGMSDQGLHYGLLAKINNPGRSVRVVWSMMKRSMRSGTAKPPFYQRYELSINDAMIRQYYEALHGQIQDMLRTESMLNEGHPHHIVAYASPNGECSWKCDYFAVCGLMNDPNNDVDWIFENHFTKFEPKKPGQDFHGQIVEELAVPVTIT
jgi:hypothetical protein